MKRKLLWGTITLACLLFFTLAIPINIFNSYTTILTLVAGIMTTGALAMFTFSFVPKPEPNEENAKAKDNGFCALLVGLVIFFFAFSIYLIFAATDGKTKELKEHGVYTTAIILDGESIKTRKADFSNLILQYETKDGVKRTVKADISASEFSRYAKNQEIPIVYSERYPDLVEILRSDKDVEMYTQKHIKELTLANLLALTDMKNPEEINTFLNNINEKWDYQNGDDAQTVVYYNKMRNIGIKMTGKNELTYLYNDINPVIFKDEMAKLGFKQMQGESGRLFTNGTYIMSIAMQNIESGQQDGMASFDTRTVVSILKTGE